MSSEKTIFGIDLGTTYSAIAYVDEYSLPRVLMNRENTAVTPSVVYFENPQNVLVGGPAKDAGQIDPKNFVELIKRCMGDKEHRREIHGVEYRPEQLSALILKKLKADAEALLGHAVVEAVITVPAYFNESQRVATKQAGIIAGFNDPAIISEPVAAAVAYAATEAEDQTLLVYDLGGGTFNVSVIRVEGNLVRVVCVDGDHDLGGRNWDERVVTHLIGEWRHETGSSADPLLDLETQQELFKQAEGAKRLLTNLDHVPLKVFHDGQSARLRLSREKFDELTADLLARTVTLTDQAMNEAARHGVTSVDKILLVGGSSYMPQVQSRLQSQFPCVELLLFEPEQAVAKGAALYAASKQIKDLCDEAARTFFGERKTYEQLTDSQKSQVDAEVRESMGLLGDPSESLQSKIIDPLPVCSRNFGVSALDLADRPVVDYLIHRNSPVPATKENEYETRHPDQSEIPIKVYETEGRNPPEDPEDPACRMIKQIMLNLPGGLPAGHPIRVRFSLSEDGGQLHVQAWDPRSGRAIEDTVNNLGALMEQEVQELREQLRRVNLR